MVGESCPFSQAAVICRYDPARLDDVRCVDQPVHVQAKGDVADAESIPGDVMPIPKCR